MGIPIVTNIMIPIQSEERFVPATNAIQRDAHSTEEYDDPENELIKAIQEREEQGQQQSDDQQHEAEDGLEPEQNPTDLNNPWGL